MATIKSIEEKAKSFEEALSRAKGFYKRFPEYKEILEKIFPELKESEDERIWLINYLSNRILNSTIIAEKENLKKAIAWLEKKGEQKPIISYDALREGIGHFGITQYQIDYWLKKYVEVEKQSKQNPADKVEPKFHEGDMIIHKELGGDYIHNPHKIIQVDILDKKYRLEGGLVAHFNEQDDYELVEQKTAWSEEDEKIIFKMMFAFTTRVFPSSEECGSFIDFLKSLKPTWKPSELQIEALESATANCAYSEYKDCLQKLAEQLKKLKG